MLSSNYLIKIRNDVFNEMIIKMMDVSVKEEIEDVPEVENVVEEKPVENNNVTTNNNNTSSNKNNNYVINYDKTTLTLITCTKNNDTSQTVYIAELV